MSDRVEVDFQSGDTLRIQAGEHAHRGIVARSVPIGTALREIDVIRRGAATATG